MRGILKRSTLVTPESESQKRVALDTEQDSTPRTTVLYGGSSASGVRPSATTSTDQNASTNDATRARNTLVATSRWRETVQAKTVEVTRAQWSQTAEGGSQRNENHVKSGMSTQAPLNSTFREGSSGRRRREDVLLLSPRRRHWRGSVRRQ